MVRVSQAVLEAVQKQLRKQSVVAHWIWGVTCGITSAVFFPASLVLLLIFGWWEQWNDRNEKIRQGKGYKNVGDLDFWDSFVVYCGPFGIILFLNLFGLITIRWY